MARYRRAIIKTRIRHCGPITQKRNEEIAKGDAI
jgi:hypothetical protein